MKKPSLSPSQFSLLFSVLQRIIQENYRPLLHYLVEVAGRSAVDVLSLLENKNALEALYFGKKPEGRGVAVSFSKRGLYDSSGWTEKGEALRRIVRRVINTIWEGLENNNSSSLEDKLKIALVGARDRVPTRFFEEYLKVSVRREIEKALEKDLKRVLQKYDNVAWYRNTAIGAVSDVLEIIGTYGDLIFNNELAEKLINLLVVALRFLKDENYAEEVLFRLPPKIRRMVLKKLLYRD